MFSLSQIMPWVATPGPGPLRLGYHGKAVLSKRCEPQFQTGLVASKCHQRASRAIYSDFSFHV